MNLLLVVVFAFVVWLSRIVLSCFVVMRVCAVFRLVVIWVVGLVMTMKVSQWCLDVMVVNGSLLMVVVMPWRSVV